MKYFYLTMAMTALIPVTVNSAPVYKITNDDGTVIYTDTPSAQSEEVTFNGITDNVTPSIPASPATPPVASSPAIRYTVSIVSPQPEATVRNNNGKVTIKAQAAPKPTGRFQLIFDGEPIQRNSAGIFALSGINRGAHPFSVALIDNKGKTLASSQQQTLYLHQASALINGQGGQ